jgi:hypothetical protein
LNVVENCKYDFIDQLFQKIPDCSLKFFNFSVDAVEILDSDEVLVLVESSNQTYGNITDLKLFCCAQRVNQEDLLPKFFFSM